MPHAITLALPPSVSVTGACWPRRAMRRLALGPFLVVVFVCATVPSALAAAGLGVSGESEVVVVRIADRAGAAAEHISDRRGTTRTATRTKVVTSM